MRYHSPVVLVRHHTHSARDAACLGSRPSWILQTQSFVPFRRNTGLDILCRYGDGDGTVQTRMRRAGPLSHGTRRPVMDGSACGITPGDMPSRVKGRQGDKATRGTARRGGCFGDVKPRQVSERVPSNGCTTDGHQGINELAGPGSNCCISIVPHPPGSLLLDASWTTSYKSLSFTPRSLLAHQ